MINRNKLVNIFGKKSGKYPILGTTTDESRLRESGWIKTGCNNFKKGNEKSLPLSFWDIRISPDLK